MGLLKGLAMLPLAPVAGVVWVAEQIQHEVDRELLDSDAIVAELGMLQRAVDDGELSEEEYLRIEEDLLDRLDAMRESE